MTIESCHPPFFGWAGPRKPKLLLVGEAWGESEASARQPFVGAAGEELWRCLGQVIPDEPELWAKGQQYWPGGRNQWLEATDTAITNVFCRRPPENKLEPWCGTKAELKALDKNYALPALMYGKYLLPQYLPELERLKQEIAEAQPNLILALGNTACWALLEATNISSIRGSIAWSHLGFKVLPTYHPAALFRTWSWRPILLADLMKAWREKEFPEVRRPGRRVLVEPELEDIERWVVEFDQAKPPLLSADIETAGGQITEISFAYQTDDAITVPFVRQQPKWAHYWESAHTERKAWELVKILLESPTPKLGQNFIYDLQYILKMGIKPRNCLSDTMLAHHSLFPELQKGLGFLGSIYTNEASWKLMRRRKADTVKGDE